MLLQAQQSQRYFVGMLGVMLFLGFESQQAHGQQRGLNFGESKGAVTSFKLSLQSLKIQDVLAVGIQLLLDVAMEQTEEAERCGSFHLPVQLLHDDLLHPHHVRNGEALLADADEVIGHGNVPLLLCGLYSDVEAAQTHARQVLWLNLHDGDEAIEQVDGQGEGLRAEAKEPGQEEEVLHLKLPQSGGHPQAVVVGLFNEPQTAQFGLVAALPICECLQLHCKGQCPGSCRHCVKHLGGMEVLLDMICEKRSCKNEYPRDGDKRIMN